MAETKVFLTKEQKEEQIKAVKAIEALVPMINEQINKLHAKACIGAFENSLTNLSKKCEVYGKEKQQVSPDEKRIMKEAARAALNDFRAKKEKEVSSNGTTNYSTEIDEPLIEVSENQMGKKKKGVKQH